jgi:hypothetical protein
MSILERRLWRARRRHDHFDALLTQDGPHWDLALLRNDRPLVVFRFPNRAAAIADADRRLRELQQAGWTMHW